MWIINHDIFIQWNKYNCWKATGMTWVSCKSIKLREEKQVIE